MALKYKIGDEVVLGENVRPYRTSYFTYFTPGTIVRIGELLDAGYTIYTIDGSRWWVNDNEINHKATEELQKSNETGDIVGKIEAVSDDNAKWVQTPDLKENATQTAPQSIVEGSFSNPFSTVYNSVSVFHKSNNEECLKISIDEGILVFQQECDGDIQEILLDFDAVGVVFSAANELIVQYKENK